MGRRGPAPRERAVGEYHIRLSDDRIKIIDRMGLGKTVEKILYLIDQEGKRQQPHSKLQMMAKWERDRKETMRMAAQTNEDRKRLLDMGLTVEELDQAEENGDEGT